MANMRLAVAGLGVMCNDCHVATDRSSDEKEMKVTARMMFQMVNDINAKFPDGKAHVTCYTCHRGTRTPLTAPPLLSNRFFVRRQFDVVLDVLLDVDPDAGSVSSLR